MAILYAAITLTALSLRGQTLILSPNNDPTVAKTGVSIYLTVLNESETATNWTFPSVLEARVYRPGATTGIESNFSIVKKSGAVPLAPGSFARAAMPGNFCTRAWWLDNQH